MVNILPDELRLAGFIVPDSSFGFSEGHISEENASGWLPNLNPESCKTVKNALPCALLTRFVQGA